MSADQESSPAEAGEACHYGSYYYEHCCGTPYDRNVAWLYQFRRLAGRIADEIAPESVLDAGCAMGMLVEALNERGVDAFGVDISSYAISKARETLGDRCRVGSVLEPFGRRYDLIVSIEVLEHLPPDDAERAVENFCAHADDVVFSSTPFDYKEASHFNVQPPEYWAERFARHGFHRDLDYDASFIAPWAVRFRKAKKPATRIVADYERKLWRLLQENLGARDSLMEHQDALARAEADLAEARARNEHLEEASREFDARMAERYAAEAALAGEFNRTVTAWSDHVQGLDHAMRHWSDHVRNLEADLRRSDERHAALMGEIAARDRLLAESERRLEAMRDEVRIALPQKAAVERDLAEIHSSAAWRLAHRLSRLRSRLAPEGSRRGRAVRAVANLGSRRADAAQPAAPAFAKRPESEISAY